MIVSNWNVEISNHSYCFVSYFGMFIYGFLSIAQPELLTLTPRLVLLCILLLRCFLWVGVYCLVCASIAYSNISIALYSILGCFLWEGVYCLACASITHSNISIALYNMLGCFCGWVSIAQLVAFIAQSSVSIALYYIL